MAISLRKGQSLSLVKKADGSAHNKVRVGLGWEVISTPLDLDATLFLCKGDVVEQDENMIFFGQRAGVGNCVVHSGDNRTGAGDGDDESIKIDFSLVSSLLPNVDTIMVLATIFQGDKDGNPLPESQMNQHFGMMKDAYVKVYDDVTGEVICDYDLDATYPDNFAVHVGNFVKEATGWRFDAIGKGFDMNLMSIAKMLKVPAFS